MKIGNTDFTIIGADPDQLAKVLNEEFPNREALIGSYITAVGPTEFMMLEENLGMHWVSFFLKLLDFDTTGIRARLDSQGVDLNIGWLFLETE